MCDEIEKFSKLKDEFNFQKHWIKIFLRGKFLLQELPEKSILLIATKLNAISFVRLMQTCKWLHILISENKPEILIFSSHTVYLPIEELTDDEEESAIEPQIELLACHKFILKPASLISLHDEKFLFKLIEADLYELLELYEYFSTKKNIGCCKNNSSRSSNLDYIIGVASDLDHFLRKCTHFLLSSTSTICDCYGVIKSFILAIELAIREFDPFEEIYFIFGYPIEEQPANNKLFDYSIILYPSMIEICGKISQTPTNLLIHFSNLPPITYSLCLKTETRQEIEQDDNTDGDDDLQISDINRTLIKEVKRGGNFTHLFQQSSNDFQLDKELFDPNLQSKLPPLQRGMPSDDVTLEIFQNIIEARRKWMKQLQKGKFILEILPLNCVLEVVKRMETVEFVRMQKTSKWISELIENKRSTFIKSFEPSDDEDAIQYTRLEMLDTNALRAWYEVSDDFNSWNNFLFPCITFVYGLNDIAGTRDLLRHLRGSNIFNHVLNMGDYSTLIPEALEAFRSRELVIYKYQLDSIRIPSFPSTLKKIRIEFDDDSLDAEYFDFVDCVSTFKGKLKLFGDFESNSSLSDKLQALLRMKRRNLDSKHISGAFFIKPSEFYVFEEVFPPTEDNFTFKKVLKIFKKETEGDSPSQEIITHCEFGICLKRAGPGAIVILTFMKRPATSYHLQRKLQYYIDFIATFQDFRDLIHAKFFKFLGPLCKYEKEMFFVEQDNDLVSVLEAKIVEESAYIEIENKFFASF